MRYNAVIGRTVGPNTIHFKDGTKIIYQQPPARVSGFLFGARVTEYYDGVTFTDEKNNLFCQIKFSEGAGLLISRNALPTDCFE